MGKVLTRNAAKDQILKGNCLDVFSTMPKSCADLIFADPPYNLQLDRKVVRPDDKPVDAVREEWDKFSSLEVYDLFTRTWLEEVRRLLKPHGSIWVIGSYHNIYRLGSMLQDTGYWILNDIVWRKTNPMPNFRGRRFTNAHETLIWASKTEKSRYTFNYESMKAFNEDIQMRSDEWVMPVCKGPERVKGEDGKKLHPTQKPLSLMQRIILSTTKPGDTVLDPFLGTGTTAVAAKQLGRHYIGIENDPVYIKAARERVKATLPLPEMEISPVVGKGKEKRIPFGTLLEMGLLNSGAKLYNQNGEKAARIRADGSLLIEDFTGSIHKAGALAKGSTVCNGWTYWHTKTKDGLLSIDELRKQARTELGL